MTNSQNNPNLKNHAPLVDDLVKSDAELISIINKLPEETFSRLAQLIDSGKSICQGSPNRKKI